MKLFVIGNGFDMAHSMPTSYGDFRDFLEEHYWEFLMQFESAYGYSTNIDEGDPYTAPIDDLIDRIKGQLWRDFENNLVNISEDEIVDSVTGMDLGLEMGNIGVEDTMNEYLRSEYQYIKDLGEYLLEWVQGIEISLHKITNQIFEDDNSKFFSFNYTLVLEELYGIDEVNVLHIHGSTNVDDGEPLIGHGNTTCIERARRESLVASDRFDEMATSAYSAVADYYENTLKDVDFLLFINSYYFDSLTDVDEVHIVGHSLGDVDMPYLSRIRESVDENAIWHVYYYNPDDADRFRAKISGLDISDDKIVVLHSNDFYRR